MKIPIPEGLFVTLDGMGEGKAIHAVMLAQYFSGKGVICTLSKEPTLEDLPVPASLDERLWAWWQTRVSHSERSVLPTLRAQGIAILEVSDSSLVWQDLHQFKHGPDFSGLTPDLQIILDVPPNLRVASGRGDLQSDTSRGAPGGATNAIHFLRERVETDDNVLLVEGSGSMDHDHERVRLAVVRAAVGKIARWTDLNADAVNDVIQLLENNEEIWGLWPELDEVLSAGPHWRSGSASGSGSGSAYLNGLNGSKVIPLHS
ncbi:MAG: hypothetical protein R3F19_30905 [Verrucomicrobiales bacterium]